MSEPLLRLEKVSKYYTGNQAVVVGLNGISLNLSRGEFVAITGESGSGKSTLSHVLGGILPYESGEMYFNGGETSHFDSADWERYRRDNISFISQNYGILAGATVMTNVVSALVLAGMGKSESKAAAEKILRQVELWDLRRRRAAKLSSGQKQRLSIARALAKPAPILIADEPTGNLDPENSAKVISLLAQAAQDRLVILITHEFDEAKDLATRHIVLQEGKVASDTELRPASEPKHAPETQKGKKRPLSPYVAKLQYSSRPVWTSIMVLFFAMTAFAVFAFLGVFIISLDDTSTRIYDNSAFRNGDMTRIAVMKGDMSAFTDEDYETILSQPHVVMLDKSGYSADAQYAYRNNFDYQLSYSEKSENDGLVRFIQVSSSILANAPYVKTVPMLPKGKTFLKDGRLPKNFSEVVSADPELKIGDTVTVYLCDLKNWNIGAKVEVKMTVVGTTNIGSNLYFHDDVGFFFRQALASMDAVRESSRSNVYFYLPVDNLDDSTFRGSPLTFSEKNCYYRHMFSPEDFTLPDGVGLAAYISELYNSDKESIEFPYIDENGDEQTGIITKVLASTFALANGETEPVLFLERDENGEEHIEEVQVSYTDLLLAGYFDSYYTDESGNRVLLYNPNRLVEVSYNDFYRLTDISNSDQISINIDSYAYTDRVINNLRSLGYTAVSPYQLGSTKQDEGLAKERSQTLKVCLMALAAVVALQIVLLRAMFGMQTASYKLLSNIGLTGFVAKLSVVWQMLVFTVAGQILGGLGIWICAEAGVKRIHEIMSYLPAKYILILSGVHLAVSVFSTIWIVAALGRQVYPFAGKFEDIALNDAGKED